VKLLALAGLALAACSTATPAQRANEFVFSPRQDASVGVDALFYYPSLGMVEAIDATNAAFRLAAAAHCDGEFKEEEADALCHEAQQADEPGTVVCVRKVIRCVGNAS
jgi:hypothetical protein